MTFPPSDGEGSGDVQGIQDQFARFARGHPHLSLYRAICRGVAKDPETAALLLAAQPGQARPVLFLAAVHDLVLRDPRVPAARWYPSVVPPGRLATGDPWPDVQATVLEHADALRTTIATRRTQTNEVNRSVYVAVGLALASRDLPGRPAVLVELGASAGLLLGVDRYRIELHRQDRALVLGDPDSPVTCHGEDRSPAPPPTLRLPPVTGRVGLDAAPVDLENAESVRWLEACLWPDEPGRVERFRAAVGLLRAEPPPLLAGDMVDDLESAVEAVLTQPGATHRPQPHLIVFSSWALTYVKRERRAEVAAVLARIARTVPSVSWVTAEPPGCVPGLPTPQQPALGDDTTVLAGRRWREGRELPAEVWGSCQPHGRWVALSGTALGGIR